MAMWRSQRGLFLCIFLFIVVVNSVKFSEGDQDSLGTKFELIHRHDPRRGWPPTTQLQRLTRLLRSDRIRVHGISHTLRHKYDQIGSSIRRKLQESSTHHPACTNGTKAYNVSGEMSMNSGADYGAGQYVVHFKVGSPAQTLVLIADTGSDLTWMHCKYRCRGVRCMRKLGGGRVFLADHSSSFRTVPCSSSMCKIQLADLFSLARCPSPMDPCAYDYRYSDGSAALGLFAKETVTFSLTNGRQTRLHDVLVGCSEAFHGRSFQGTNGVLGLGYSNYSFALEAAKKFGGRFSYCLVDHLSSKNVSSYLIFGSHKRVTTTLNRMQYTELVLGVMAPFYGVNVKGISIGGTILEIPAEVWDVNGAGGAIVDSGSSLTYLTQPAYQPVMAALRPPLLNFSKLNLDIVPLEYCFNSTGFDQSLVPRFGIHFADGARFEPPVKSYVIDAAEGVKCLGFVAVAWPGASVMGNIMQQNHFWEFDLANKRLGFASSSCT